MKYYGTKNNKEYEFYEENFENAIEITDEYWTYLLAEQALGKRIIPYGNNVLAIDTMEYTEENGSWRKLTPEETEAIRKKLEDQNRIYEIERELEELDRKRIRAISEPSLKDEETTWLEYYNQQIQSLRQELQQLQNT